ncbi:S41 family peptidase [Gynurincola endophyticus]|uniref:S41 family peptidase n=1 Tax=Gynurincola endophyticus TaxID=2479004 RepID=UPI000F8C301C|nr:S41 family peptidase [Gynurincola endophyticus]
MRSTLLGMLLLLFSQMQAQQLNKISTVDKIYGLSNYWQEVNYNFVYFDKVDKTVWNEAYKKLIEKIPALNDFEYYLELQKMSALLNDGHTQVYLPDELDGQWIINEFGDLKLATDYIENKVVVTRIIETKKELLPIGTEVLKVNNIPIQQYLEQEVTPYLSVSSPHVKVKRAAQLLFKNLAGTNYTVEYKKPDGKVNTLKLSLKRFSGDAKMYPVFPKVEVFSSKWINQNTYYIKILSFENAGIYDEFLKVLPELKKAKSLIIDIRYNGGGSSVLSRKIAQHLVNDSLIYGAKNQSRLLIPTDKALGSFLTPADTVNGKKEWGLDKEQTLMHYKAAQGSLMHQYPYQPSKIPAGTEKIIIPTVILTESTTASAAEDFLIFTSNQPHIKRIGNFTNGSTGQPLLISLPIGGEAWICTKKVLLPDGTEFIGKGIEPHIKAEYTVKDLLKNEDSVLEKAVVFLK